MCDFSSTVCFHFSDALSRLNTHISGIEPDSPTQTLALTLAHTCVAASISISLPLECGAQPVYYLCASLCRIASAGEVTQTGTVYVADSERPCCAAGTHNHVASSLHLGFQTRKTEIWMRVPCVHWPREDRSGDDHTLLSGRRKNERTPPCAAAFANSCPSSSEEDPSPSSGSRRK